ncbi:unnamed protein product [Closterium sp. NIES-53]
MRMADWLSQKRENLVARYSSPATAALGCLLLPYLFPELSAFATVEDLVSHLCASDARYPAAAPAEDHFLSLDPTSLTVDLLEQHLLAAETGAVAVGAARGTPRPPFFEGKGKGGNGSGGGSGGGGGGSGSSGGGSSGGGWGGGTCGGSGGSGGGGGGSGGSVGNGGSGTGGSGTGARRVGSGGGQRIADAALGASESGTLPGTAPAQALHTFTLDSNASRWSSLYTLATEPPQVAASAQVSASGQVATSCSCRLLTHQTLLWHHRLGHPSLPRLRGMHSRLLISGLPRSLPPLPPSPALPCLPCVEGRKRAAPHSSFPPTTATLQTLYMDVWGPARVSGQSRERYFLLVVDDYTRYTTVFPLRSKGQVVDVLIPWICTIRLQLHERFGQDLPVMRLHSDRGADKLSPSAINCVFFGFVLDAPGWQFYHPTSRHVFSSQDVTFDELVPFYRLFPYRSAPPPPPPLFLALGSPLVDPLPPQSPAPSGVSQVDPLPDLAPVQVAVNSSAARGAASGGAEPRGAESEGVGSGGAEPRGEEPGGAEPVLLVLCRDCLRSSYVSGLFGAHAFGVELPAGGAGGTAGASGTGGTAATGPGGARTRGTGAAGGGGAMCACMEFAAVSALVAELLDFAAACCLDYATALVAESESASPPSVGGECALGTDVLEDRQEDFECLAAAIPRFASMVLAPEGDPDAPDIPTPRSYAEAITGANIVDGMWIFRVKRPPGSPPAFKARYVAQGFSLQQGVDYFQTVSPTPKKTTLWVLLHVTAQRDYELHSLDFNTAFLQGSLHETTLAALGFAPSTADLSLFLRTDTSLPPFYVLVYVDELVFAIADTEAVTHVKSDLQKRHTCTDLGELRSYLGLQITRDRAQCTITLTQSHMVHQVLQRFSFQFSSPQPTPQSTGHSLSAPPSDESVEPSGPYPELVGCLMYLMMCTRPNLAYPLSLLARYVAPGRHRKVHWDAAKRVLCYLCSTSGMGLLLGGRGPIVLTGHLDASWADDQATQRLSEGYTFSLGSGSVSWRSTRSSLVLSSSCEAEIYAGAMAAQELRWLTYLLTDLGEQPRSPPVLYVDNKAMIALCQEHRLEHQTKHIALRYFLARELQQRGQLCLAYVATRANTADVFTKALLPSDHQRFVTVLGLVPTLPHLLTA